VLDDLALAQGQLSGQMPADAPMTLALVVSNRISGLLACAVLASWRWWLGLGMLVMWMAVRRPQLALIREQGRYTRVVRRLCGAPGTCSGWRPRRTWPRGRGYSAWAAGWWTGTGLRFMIMKQLGVRRSRSVLPVRDHGRDLLAMTVTSTSMPATRSARIVVRTGLAGPGNAPS
jgi:hypothetical protein